MKKSFKSILIIFNLILCGCNVSEQENGLISPLEGNVKFKVAYDSTEIFQSYTGYIFVMESEKIYTCCNFEILSSTRINSKLITIDLYGIYRPEICATALGPARLNLPLEISNGSYDLTISYRYDIDKYELDIEDFNISMTPIDTSFTKYDPSIKNR